VNKADLVKRVARDTGLSKADVLRVLDATLAQVTRALRRGDFVKLVDFGVFRVAHRRARAAFNPHSGTAMKLAARRFPRFAPGKRLRALVR
jgi:DNA-binding protein HU-beta